jgi:hypothetical protein
MNAGEIGVSIHALEVDGDTEQDGEFMPSMIVLKSLRFLGAVKLELSGHSCTFDADKLLSTIRRVMEELDEVRP